MLAVLLALTASLAWGTSDFLGGLESRRTTFWAVALVGQAAAFAGAVLVLVVTAPAFPPWSIIAVPLLGGGLSALGSITLYRAFTLAPISVISPVFAGAALVPVLWGIAAGERPSPIQATGVVVAILGIVLISRRGPEGTQRTGERRRAAVLLALTAAVAWGLLFVVYDYAGETDPYWTVVAARSTSVVVIAIVVLAVRPVLRLDHRALPVLVVIGLLLAAANVLFTVSSTLGYLSIVAVLGGLSPAITVFWAWALTHERLRPAQWAAAAMVFAGVVCLATG